MEEERWSLTDPPPNLENGNGFSFTPSFYTIITVPCKHRLVLPKNFVEEHGGELSGKIQLDLPVDGGKWYIGLKMSGGDLVYLHRGWENFMNYYSICFGWFMLFKYKGNSVFDVHIFDLKAAEIQYPTSPPPVCRIFNIGGKSSHTDCDAICKEVFDDDDDDAEIREKESVVDAARKMYKSVNPSFSITLKDYNIRNGYIVNLPTEFTKKHMINDCPEFIKIVDSDNKMWRVRCLKHGVKRVLSKGWGKLVKEKGLQIGDVCVFELVKKSAILKVDVFRAKKRMNK